MNLLRFIQSWRQQMALKKRSTVSKPSIREIPFELVPVDEDPVLFQQRKEEAQILLIRMALSLHKRGRPKKEGIEESQAP